MLTEAHASKNKSPVRPTFCLCWKQCYRGRMTRALELILSLAAAGATAFLLALITRYDLGMSVYDIRIKALSAACDLRRGRWRITAQAEKIGIAARVPAPE